MPTIVELLGTVDEYARTHPILQEEQKAEPESTKSVVLSKTTIPRTAATALRDKDVNTLIVVCMKEGCQKRASSIEKATKKSEENVLYRTREMYQSYPSGHEHWKVAQHEPDFVISDHLKVVGRLRIDKDAKKVTGQWCYVNVANLDYLANQNENENNAEQKQIVNDDLEQEQNENDEHHPHVVDHAQNEETEERQKSFVEKEEEEAQDKKAILWKGGWV